MNFHGTLISVKDVSASRKFYEDLFGLKLEFDFGENISFDCGLALQQDFAELMGIPSADITYKTNNFELYFEAEDFMGFVEKLKSYPNINFVHDVKEYSWGQHVIRFYDLDYHIIEVGENMVEVTKRFLNKGMTVEEIMEKTMLPRQFIEECF